jgi:hypothetical protein
MNNQHWRLYYIRGHCFDKKRRVAKKWAVGKCCSPKKNENPTRKFDRNTLLCTMCRINDLIASAQLAAAEVVTLAVFHPFVLRIADKKTFPHITFLEGCMERYLCREQNHTLLINYVPHKRLQPSTALVVKKPCKGFAPIQKLIRRTGTARSCWYPRSTRTCSAPGKLLVISCTCL